MAVHDAVESRGDAGRGGGTWDGVAENDLRVRPNMEDREAAAPGPAPRDGQGAVAAAVARGADAGPGHDGRSGGAAGRRSAGRGRSGRDGGAAAGGVGRERRKEKRKRKGRKREEKDPPVRLARRQDLWACSLVGFSQPKPTSQ